jgi:hypothetical protein
MRKTTSKKIRLGDQTERHRRKLHSESVDADPGPLASSASDDLTAVIGRIANAPRSALIEAWTDAYGSSPPTGISRRLLEYAAAYHLQVRAFGGLKPITRRTLRRICEAPSDSTSASPRSNRRAFLPAESRLVREWNGRIHTVDVVESRFVYNGRPYGSLSEIARVITGTRWSGPRFFGL